MSNITSKGYIQQAKNFIYIFIVLGFMYGFIKAIIHIKNNQYLSYKLHNLIAPEFYNNITKYAILSLIFALVVIALIPLFRIVENWISKYKMLRNRYYILIFFIASIIILAVCYIYYLDLIQILKNNPVIKWLGYFSVSGQNTFQILKTALIISAIFLISFVSYIIWPKTLEKFINSVSAFIERNKIKYVSLILIILLVFLKIYIFTYEGLNKPEGPNIVLISIDTLRADRLGSYGYERNTSPNMDKLAKEGILFVNAFSQAPWTLPSMVTMHTSLYPSKHGAVDAYSKLDDRYVTIAEYLKNNFYKTIGVISQSFVSSHHGFSQGFEIFDEKNISGERDVSSEPVTERAIEYLVNNHSDPFFLWVHHYDPHYSYINHEKFDYGSAYTGSLPNNIDPNKIDIKEIVPAIPELSEDDIQYIEDIYHEEISYTDKYIGDLIDTLHDLGIYDNTIIIITSDHGEQFLERGGFGHGKLLYQELIRVPLIIHLPEHPEFSNLRIEENVEIRNIPSTILELIGIENYFFGGTSLINAHKQDSKSVFSEGSYAWGNNDRKKGVIYKNWKLIQNIDDDTYELYNLDVDPGEKTNLIDNKNPNNINLVKDLKAQLSNLNHNNVVTTEKVKFSKEDIERLKSLGYLQ